MIAGDLDAAPGECDGYPATAHVDLGPYAALVYSQDPEPGAGAGPEASGRRRPAAD